MGIFTEITVQQHIARFLGHRPSKNGIRIAANDSCLTVESNTLENLDNSDRDENTANAKQEVEVEESRSGRE